MSSRAAALHEPSLGPAYQPPRGRNAVQQSGAYALIEDGQGRVLTVQAENGRFYLPGGRIEAGENPRQALIREVAEECGWSAYPLAPLGESSQSIMGGDVELQASHWRARLVARLPSPPEHRLAWVTPDEALACLHRDCDRAAVRLAAGGPTALR